MSWFYKLVEPELCEPFDPKVHNNISVWHIKMKGISLQTSMWCRRLTIIHLYHNTNYFYIYRRDNILYDCVEVFIYRFIHFFERNHCVVYYLCQKRLCFWFFERYHCVVYYLCQKRLCFCFFERNHCVVYYLCQKSYVVMVCLSVSWIIYKVMNGFAWNFYQRCVSGQGTIH